MYRPGSDSQCRPRVAVPPPPPQGMINYVAPRQMPPPLHARPQPIPHFSYGATPAAPPSSSHVPLFAPSMPTLPPVLQVAPFVPPLPLELPPPPPSSPPPPPPPLPLESLLAISAPIQSSADGSQTKEALSVPLPENRGHAGSKNDPEIYNRFQQKTLSTANLDTENFSGHHQHHSDWNSTYQDTLDDEAASPATSDMDMDVEDSDHTNGSCVQELVDGGGIVSHVSGRAIEYPQRSGVSHPTITDQRQMTLHSVENVFSKENHIKMAPCPSEPLVRDHELHELKHEVYTIEDLSSSNKFTEGGFSGRLQTVPLRKEHCRARSSRWGSPPTLQPAQNERQHDSDDKALAGGLGESQNLDDSFNAINVSGDLQGPKIFAKTDRKVPTNLEIPVTLNRTAGILMDPQRPLIGDATEDINVLGTTLDFSDHQQEQKKVPVVDEFGRVVQEAGSDSELEGEGCHLPVDEFGRVVQKGVSGSDSEDDRRALKRKRSYSRSYSRSRSRSRGRGRSRSRSRGRSRSRSGSRSRSSSRSPTRSSGETRWRRRSFSRSPRRKMRWSRSRSRSPQWRRSYSRTPPRDMRWGGTGRGERDWRVDRDYFGRGRRGGRGSGPNPCFHFARGRCLRGNLCRYLHISRENTVQDRGAWRRDSQAERHNLDAGREDFMGDNQNRGQWRRDSWAERHEDIGGRHQEFVVEKQEREATSSSRMLSQEETSGEPSSSRVVVPPSKGEVWTPRNALEAKDIQDMAYNKALELVGIPHLPRESAMAEELVIRNNKVLVAEKKSEWNEASERDANVGISTTTTMEAPRMAALSKQGEEFPMVESMCCSGEALAMEVKGGAGKPESLDLDTRNEETGTSQKLVIEVLDSSIDVRSAENTGTVGNVADVIGESEAKDVVPNFTREAHSPERQDVEHDTSRKAEDIGDRLMNEIKDEWCTGVGLEFTGRDQEFGEQHSITEVDVAESGGRGNGFLAFEKVGRDSNSAEFEPLCEATMHLDVEGKGPTSDVSKAEVIKRSEATCSIDVTANGSKLGPQGGIEAEILGKMNVESGMSLSKDESEMMDMSPEKHAQVEGEPHVTATEKLVQMSDPAPQVFSQIPQGLQEVLDGQPAPGIPILPPPSQGPQHACTGQPTSIPLLLLPPSQGQAHPSTLPNAHSYPAGSMQQPSFTKFPRSTQYSSYRPPTNYAATASQPLDPASHPRVKYTSGTTGYLPSGGWEQQSFQPRAPTQEVASRNQLSGAPNYGTSIYQSHGPSTSGGPFSGPPTHGDKFSQHHGGPYAGDQFPHYRPSNSGDQFPQHYRPLNAGGFGQNNIGGYGAAASEGLGATATTPGANHSGGFGAPAVSQHHGSFNPGTHFSQPSNGPGPTAPFPQHPPLQSYRPPIHGSPFLPPSIPQSYGQSNQPTYGAAFPAQLGNQNQQLVNANKFSGSSASAQQLVPTQQGFSSNTSFMAEQSQSVHSFAGVIANQVMQHSVLNAVFSPSPLFPSAQGSCTWNFQAPQRAPPTPTGESLSYSYPLTTIPPLSGLVPVSQATILPLHNDQYDPLSDAPASGLDGASKTALVRSLPDVLASVGTGTTALTSHIISDSEDANTKKVSVSVSRPETLETETKNANEDVGVVENMSPENWSPGPTAEETETGQEQALSKKSSRGLKMLRSAIADHVKDVLKPTWREGYMSKEAFKTIAKKAVEKVVGNLPSHHIPKSQEKVDQFMKASRPKISKLVQGYVDKYLKL